MYIAKQTEIKRRRVEAGLNRKDLSLRAGLPSNAVSRIESGKGGSQTHPLRARAIAQALNCKVEDIFIKAKGA